MKRLSFLGAVLIVASFLISSSQAASNPKSSVSGNLVFLGSSDAPGVVAQERLKACMQQMAQEMMVADKAMPLILVVHVSNSAGEALGATQSAVRRNSGPLGSDVYYELWLVGPVGPRDYVAGMETILELHFGLQYSDPERTKMMARVLRYVQATVSANAYGE